MRALRETKVEKKRDLECRRRRRRNNGVFCVTANVTTGSILLLVFFKTPSSVSLFCVFFHSLFVLRRGQKRSPKKGEREREKSLFLSLSFSEEEEEEEEEEKCVVLLFPLFFCFVRNEKRKKKNTKIIERLLRA